MSKFSYYARMLGRIKTPKKAAASRINGRLGGRPKSKGSKTKGIDGSVLGEGKQTGS